MNDVDRAPVTVTPATRVRVSPSVVCRAFPNETVILDLETGKYFGVSPSGGRMLDALSRTDHVQQVAAECAAHFNRSRSEMEADVCELFEDLLRRGILVAADG